MPPAEVPKKRRANKKKPYNQPKTPVAVLGEFQLDDDEEKDDEERELESMLFGKKKSSFGPRGAANGAGKAGKGKGKGKQQDVEADLSTEVAGELGYLMDEELFFMDAPGEAPSVSTLDNNNSVDLDAPIEDDSDSDEDSELGQKSDSDDSSEDDSDSDMEAASSSGSSSSGSSTKQTVNSTSTTKKPKAAWIDPDDLVLKVSLSTDNRLRKLRKSEGEDIVSGRDLEGRLRGYFQSIHPIPVWVSKNRTDASKLSPFTALLQSSTPFLASRPKLPPGTLDIYRLKDLKGSGQGGVKDLAWAPGGRNILAVAGSDRRLRVYTVDGILNERILTLHTPQLPVSKITWHPTGSSLILSGSRPFLHILSLHTGQSIKAPLPNSTSKSLHILAFNTTGTICAMAGKNGHVDLINWDQLSGPNGVIGSLKLPGGGKVASLKFKRDGADLWVLEQGKGEVSVWDVEERKCVARWNDAGAWGSRVLETTEDKFAVGSSTGIINIYNTPSRTSSATLTSIKAFENMTTPISDIQFNIGGEILAAASKEKKDALKLFHVPSLTTFSNWPTASTPVGHVTCLGFSPSSDLAIGNSKGKVTIWRCRAYQGR